MGEAPAQKYPLWCIDTQRETEDRYRGPFATLPRAQLALVRVWDDFGNGLPRPILRRCRALRFSELTDPQGMVDLVVDEPPEFMGAICWADWGESVAEVVSVEGLDRCIKTRIYVCEGDE